jgi:aminocarboxymuconate-semialdehyde decarboxylase
MWYDTVGHSHIPALRCAIESFGADRLLLGTDFPYEAGELFIHAVQHISASGIPAAQTNAIMNTTAAALLNRHTG